MDHTMGLRLTLLLFKELPAERITFKHVAVDKLRSSITFGAKEHLLTIIWKTFLKKSSDYSEGQKMR